MRHNQRFYLNPENEKLEIIGYDGYDDTGSDDLSVPFIDSIRFRFRLTIPELFFPNIFKDYEFVRILYKTFKTVL